VDTVPGLQRRTIRRRRHRVRRKLPTPGDQLAERGRARLTARGVHVDTDHPARHPAGDVAILAPLLPIPLHVPPFTRPRSLSARRVLRRREFRALGQRQREPACGAIRLPMSRVQDSMSSLTSAAGPAHSTGPAALLSLKREIVVGGLSALLVRPDTHLGTPPDELTNLDGV